jgi:hypothetical protein
MEKPSALNKEKAKHHEKEWEKKNPRSHQPTASLI